MYRSSLDWQLALCDLSLLTFYLVELMKKNSSLEGNLYMHSHVNSIHQSCMSLDRLSAILCMSYLLDELLLREILAISLSLSVMSEVAYTVIYRQLNDVEYYHDLTRLEASLAMSGCGEIQAEMTRCVCFTLLPATVRHHDGDTGVRMF